MQSALRNVSTLILIGLLAAAIALTLSGCKKSQTQNESAFSSGRVSNENDSLEGGESDDLIPGRSTRRAVSELPKKPYKLVFDFEDIPALTVCRALSIADELQKASSFRRVEEQLEQGQTRSNLIATVSGLKIDDSLPDSIKQFFLPTPVSPEGNGANTPNTLYDFLMEGYFKQKVQGQSFWHFTKATETSEQGQQRATEFSAIVKQKKAELENSNWQKLELQVRHYNPANEIVVETTGNSVFYKTPVKQKILKRLQVELNLESAWWLRNRVEAVGDCLAKYELADKESSRESIRAAILFLFFREHIADNLK